MDKAQALHNFWSSFNLPAYDEGTVPNDAQLPYITYSVVTDNFDHPLQLSASVWYDSMSWKEITNKTKEISSFITEHGYYISRVGGGYIWITRGTPFAQRISDPERGSIRRMYINIGVEFLTAF